MVLHEAERGARRELEHRRRAVREQVLGTRQRGAEQAVVPDARRATERGQKLFVQREDRFAKHPDGPPRPARRRHLTWPAPQRVAIPPELILRALEPGVYWIA